MEQLVDSLGVLHELDQVVQSVEIEGQIVFVHFVPLQPLFVFASPFENAFDEEDVELSVVAQQHLSSLI